MKSFKTELLQIVTRLNQEKPQGRIVHFRFFGRIAASLVFFLVLSLHFHLPVCAQTGSLFQTYLHATDDSTRYNALYNLIRGYADPDESKGFPDAVGRILNRSILELRISGQQALLGRFLGLKAESELNASRVLSADQYCDSAIHLANKFNDSEQLGNLNWIKMRIYQKMNLRERMVEALCRAVEEFGRAGDLNREADMLFELGKIYTLTEQNDLASRTFHECIQKSRDSITSGMAFLFLAQIELQRGNVKQAGEFIFRGASVSFCSIPSKSFFYFFIRGRWLKAMQKVKESLESFRMAALEARKGGQLSQLIQVLCEMAELEISGRHFVSAEKLLIESKNIAYSKNLVERKVDVHRVFTLYYEQTANPMKALEEYKNWQIYKDSLYKNELSRALTRSIKENEYNEIEQKRSLEQRKADEMQARRLRVQKISAFSVSAILVFIGMIAVILFRSNRQQKTANSIIEKERQRSDNLLHNILPEEVARELKTTGEAGARDFPFVTVLFTDFKNFTSLSERLTAEELVNEINIIYSAFDEIVLRWGIEKIKTIGDSYMCAGGLPVENMTNPFDVAEAALDMRDYISEIKQRRISDGLPFFDIRIGLHTGPVVAGVVGTKKFAYDIWGDTVNVASRMESSGEPGKVNISDVTFKIVKERFACEYRGKVSAKNKGMIDMYFIERKG